MFKVVKRMSKKGNEYIALVYEGVRGETFVSFDLQVISKVSGKTIKELYLSDADIYLD